MGKKIDCFVLSAGIALVLFFYFYGILGNRIAAIVLALLACTLLNRLMKALTGIICSSRYMKKRNLRKHSRSAMMYLACMDEEEAAAHMNALIAGIYGEGHTVAILQCHPSTTVRQEDIFRLWKQHRACDRLVICATGHSDAPCRTMADELSKPRVALIDAGALSQLIAEHPEGMFPPEEHKQIRRLKLRRLADLMLNRKNAPKCLWMSLSMTVIYLFSGNIFYLTATMFLLFTAFASLRRQHRPCKLF